MGNSLATSASRTGRRTVAAFALLLLLSGCGADAGAADRPAEGLLVLTTGDPTDLDVLAAKKDSEDAVAIGLPLPDEEAAWISAGKGGVLLVTTKIGHLLTSEPVDPRGAAADLAGLEWEPVEAASDAGALPTPAWFATWDPGGARFAALAGDLYGGGEMDLLVVEPGKHQLTTIPLKRRLRAVAPVWLDADRVILSTGTAVVHFSILVDTASGKIAKGRPGVRRIATSGDGSVIATTAGPGEPIVLRSSKGWLTDDGTSIGSVDVPNGFTDAIALALDESGKRLAIVWLGEDGTPRYDVHDGADGWRRVWSQPMTGTTTAEVAWLR